jgi:putative tricarboxylic transport membrane protein
VSSTRKKDRIFGFAALVISGCYYWAATLIPASRLADAIGPQGLPKTYAVLLAVLAVILITRSLTARADAAQVDNAGRPRDVAAPAPWRVAGMLAIGVLYIAVVPWLGYLLSIAGLILATTYYQGGTINRRVALVAVAGAIFFWLLFVVLMRIPQPPGWWPPSS